MLFQEVAFWVLAVASVAASLGVVLLKDVFRSALLLVVVFLAVAGLFVMLSAEFLAVVQVLIYAGAISILVIFAIMLTREVQQGNLPNRLQPAAVVLPTLLLVALVWAFLGTEWRLLPTPLPPAMEQVFTETPTWLAGLLLREFVLPFEVASVLLLAAIIGALALVRER